MPKEKRMIELDIPTEQASLDQVIQRLAKAARSTGLDAAGSVLEALREALAAQAPHSAGRR
jgi:hypothetical protein